MNPRQHSHIDSALRYGCSILKYNDLGTGDSTKTNAFEVLQAAVEIEGLRGLTKLTRSSDLIRTSKIVGIV